MSDATQEKLPVRGDGVYGAGTNDLPNSVGVIAHERNASPSGTTQTKRVTAIEGANNSVNWDMALHDESGQPYSPSNPLPVNLVEEPGDGICSQDTSINLAKGNPGATGTHSYTVISSTFLMKEVLLSASDKAKAEVATLAGGTGTAVVRAVLYVSSAMNNFVFEWKPAVQLSLGDVVRITKINRSASDDQDVHSTLTGVSY